MITILDAAQRFFVRTGLAKPSILHSSSDAQIQQVAELANQVLDDLATTRVTWTAQTRETVFSSIPGEDQGSLELLSPGLISIVPGSLFNRTTHLKLTGPLTPAEWQAVKAVNYSSAFTSFRILNGKIFLYPAILTSEVIAYEYKSRYLVYDPELLVYKEYFSKDTDQFVLDGKVLIAGLKWMWKAEKGQPYTEDFAAYERMLTVLEGSDTVPRMLDMGDDNSIVAPGLVVPDSDWNIT